MGLREKFGPRVTHAGVTAGRNSHELSNQKRRTFKPSGHVSLSNRRSNSAEVHSRCTRVDDYEIPSGCRENFCFRAKAATSHRVNSLARAHSWRREDRAAGDGRVTPPLEKVRGTSHAREDRRARPTRPTYRAIGAHQSPGRASQIQIRTRLVTRRARPAARRGRMSSDGSTSRGSPHRARAWTTPRRRGRYANVPTLHPTRTRMYHESSRVRQTNNHD